ncbi:MAG: hypothetical protein EXR36_03685 [Betaproteobacteria bacterium]|nr:hypothetical protein [Betaproteobacteria bacterium]
MSVLADILDRLAGVATLKEKIGNQDRIIEGMQHVLLDQQKDLAELKGMMRALVSIQSEGRKSR